MNKLKLCLMSLLLCAAGSLAQLHTIVDAEYFWDTDPGPGGGTPIAIAAGETAIFDGDLISTAGLSRGQHLLNVRVQRDDGAWGESTRRKVFIGIGSDMDAAEVFFDSDPGKGNGTAVGISPEGIIDETAFSVPDVERGFHKMYLRCFSNGTWSAPVANVLRVGSAWIDGAEVFFDTDPGEGNGYTFDVTPGPDVVAQDSTVSVAASGTGFHKVYMRFRGGGVWSFPKSQTLRINPEAAGGINHIAGGEFFFDVDPGEGNGCPLIAEDGEFDNLEETMRRYVIGSSVSAGEHIVYFRVIDAGGRWYNTVRDTVVVDTARLTVIPIVDLLDRDVCVAWSNYPSAIEYIVKYDSDQDGAFADFVSVFPPDTSVVLPADSTHLFFRVAVIDTEAEPCGERGESAAVQLKKIKNKTLYK